jgi:hypothetical protein
MFGIPKSVQECKWVEIDKSTKTDFTTSTSGKKNKEIDEKIWKDITLIQTQNHITQIITPFVFDTKVDINQIRTSVRKAISDIKRSQQDPKGNQYSTPKEMTWFDIQKRQGTSQTPIKEMRQI